MWMNINNWISIFCGVPQYGVKPAVGGLARLPLRRIGDHAT